MASQSQHSLLHSGMHVQAGGQQGTMRGQFIADNLEGKSGFLLMCLSLPSSLMWNLSRPDPLGNADKLSFPLQITHSPWKASLAACLEFCLEGALGILGAWEERVLQGVMWGAQEITASCLEEVQWATLTPPPSSLQAHALPVLPSEGILGLAASQSTEISWVKVMQSCSLIKAERGKGRQRGNCTSKREDWNKVCVRVYIISVI